MVLRNLEFLEHLDTAAMINEMKALSHSASFAGFLYEGFVAKELVAAGASSWDFVSMTADKGTTKFFVPIHSVVSPTPFNRPRERSYAPFSTGPLALKFDIPLEKYLADYFWIPMAPNNTLFEGFVIEFKDSAQSVVWILRMTLSDDH